MPENQEVLDLYEAINTQFVHDFNALGLVFEIFGISCTRGEARQILDKLILIHSITTQREREEIELKREQAQRSAEGKRDRHGK